MFANTYKWWDKKVRIKNKSTKLRSNTKRSHQIRMSVTQSQGEIKAEYNSYKKNNRRDG